MNKHTAPGYSLYGQFVNLVQIFSLCPFQPELAAHNCVIAHINWISEALRRGLLIAPPDLDIDIQVFITRQSSDGMEVENASTNLSPSTPQSDKTVADGIPSVLGMSGIRVASGRPDLKALLQHEVAATQGRMSVSGTSLAYLFHYCNLLIYLTV